MGAPCAHLAERFPGDATTNPTNDTNERGGQSLQDSCNSCNSWFFSGSFGVAFWGAGTSPLSGRERGTDGLAIRPTFWETASMNTDPASLDNLREIILSPPVPWWPPAPGWWVLFALLTVVAVIAAFRAWRRWRAAAYRRAALRELAAAANASAIAEILKRTALVAYPRTEVASLSGSAWLSWLAQTGGQQAPAAVTEALTMGVFTNHEDANAFEVTTFAADWIRNHPVRRTDC